jgi:hypothetical protein
MADEWLELRLRICEVPYSDLDLEVCCRDGGYRGLSQSHQANTRLVP